MSVISIGIRGWQYGAKGALMKDLRSLRIKCPTPAPTVGAGIFYSYKFCLPNNDRLEVIIMEQKVKLLKEALSLIRVKIEIEPLKYIELIPLSEALRGVEPEDIPPPKVILMDNEMFKILWHFMRKVVVLVVPAGKEVVSLDEVEVYGF
jgi:hypothetical protein